MAKSKPNPLFTRTEKKRARKKVAHKIKGAARKGFAKLFGIPLSPGLGGGTRAKGTRRPKASHRPAPGQSVRADVVSSLRNLGYKQPQAEKMVPQSIYGEGFDSLFRRSVSKNPAELIIFGNPEKVYRRKHLKNPLPAAFVSALQSGAAEKVLDVVTRPMRTKKKNPGGTDKAKGLFEKFHQRDASGVYELQRRTRGRKDYTILGPLVAIGYNAPKFDETARRSIRAAGRPAWENHVVEHYDKLPHLAFLTPVQISHVKRILNEPDQYLQECPTLASAPNGKQLYVLSPDLEIDLAKFPDAGKDFVDLGEATFVVYIARKPADPREWVHTFGEDGGKRPRLAYARLNKEIFFIGGSYTVEAPGIMN